jgi:hypothetical protein
MNNITFTTYTATVPKILTKTISLEDGGLKKTTSGNFAEGTAEELYVITLNDFFNARKALKLNQALGFGVAREGVEVEITTNEKYQKLTNKTGQAARTKEHFMWSEDGGGMLMIDYDPPKGGASVTREELVEAMYAAVPALKDVPFLWTTSAGSCIYNSGTNEQLLGIEGQRLYIPVKDASDIPEAGNRLYNLLWLSGYGRFDISASGSLLNRSLIDSAVWETNRLDFAAGAKCIPPLEQRSEHKFYGGNGKGDEPLIFLDSFNDIRALTTTEAAELENKQRAARLLLKPDANITKQKHIRARAEAQTKGKSEEAFNAAMRVLSRAYDNCILNAEFVLQVEDPVTKVYEEVTVGKVLDSSAKYHGRLTLDPIEPEYSGNKTVGRLYLDGANKNLNSLAHGGRNFKLRRQPHSIKIVQGQTEAATNSVLDVLRTQPDWFDQNGLLVMVDGGGVVVMSSTNQDATAHHLSGVVQFYAEKNREDGSKVQVMKDPPLAVVRRLIQLGASRGLKPLRAVISAPTITPTGTLVNRHGYSAESGLYLAMPVGELMGVVPLEPSEAEVLTAVEHLLEPFSKFIMATEQDRGVLLAAILTAITRPALRTAPAFGFEAPVQGSGKTLMAECIYELATGSEPVTHPPVDDEELRKLVFSMLIADKRGLIIDNITGLLDSVALANLLTTGKLAGRILGQSISVEAVNLLLILLTGNNMTVTQDMARRVLMARIDTGVADPYRRKFGFCPRRMVHRRRQSMVAAGLTVIRGYLTSNAPKPTTDSASFEDWDAVVRQPVKWLSESLYNGKQLGDPIKAVDKLIFEAVEVGDVGALLVQLSEQFGDEPFTCAEVIKATTEHPTGKALEATILEFSGGYETNSLKVGKLFSSHRDRIVDGLMIKHHSNKNKTIRWCVTKPKEAA